MNTFTVILDISSDRLKEYYRRPQIKLRAQSLCGKILSLPLSSFQSFFSHNGLSGRFKVRANEQGKLIEVKKVG